MNNDWPFITLQLKKAGFFDKFTSHKNEENALVEINNLLAEKKSVHSISSSDIENILDKYKLTLTQKLRDKMTCFYERYLIHCLQDKRLSNEEIQDLLYLKNLFGLDDRTIESINNENAHKVYRKSYQDVIQDGSISEDEKSFLESLQNNMRLPDWIVGRINKEEATRYLQGKIDQSIEDGKLSPEEEIEIQKIAENLGATIQMDEATKRLLDKYRLFWLIENGEVPSIQVPLNFPRGEKCYFETSAELYEYRKITSRVRYSGPTARVKIIKGLYWRAGDLKFQAISKDIFSKLDTGNLYLSNKKLLFVGNNRNISIQLKKIVNFVPYKDGIEIQKETGRNQFFSFVINIDIFIALMGRALRDIS